PLTAPLFPYTTLFRSAVTDERTDPFEGDRGRPRAKSLDRGVDGRGEVAGGIDEGAVEVEDDELHPPHSGRMRRRGMREGAASSLDRKSTRLNSSHVAI